MLRNRRVVGRFIQLGELAVDEQPLQIAALSAATMRELFDFIANLGTDAYRRLLLEKATTELDVIAKRMNDEKIRIEIDAFKRGSDEQRRMSAIQAEHAKPITLKPLDFEDPNGLDPALADAPRPNGHAPGGVAVATA